MLINLIFSFYILLLLSLDENIGNLRLFCLFNKYNKLKTAQKLFIYYNNYYKILNTQQVNMFWTSM